MANIIEANSLGDKQVLGRERLQKAYEDTDKHLDIYRLPDHQHLQDKVRIGKALMSSTLISTVLKMNDHLICEDSIVDNRNAGFYLVRPDGTKKYLVAFEKGYMPEFSIIQVDRADLATHERRGWRAVLGRLIKQRVITLRQANQAFGFASDGERSRRWHRSTRKFWS